MNQTLKRSELFRLLASAAQRYINHAWSDHVNNRSTSEKDELLYTERVLNEQMAYPEISHSLVPHVRRLCGAGKDSASITIILEEAWETYSGALVGDASENSPPAVNGCAASWDATDDGPGARNKKGA